MNLIIDCNVWISFLLGFQKELFSLILQDSNIDIYVCSELIKEIHEVSERPKIQKYCKHGDVDRLFRIIKLYCKFSDIRDIAESDIRDPKDLYLLSLSETVHADYIITGDADLTSLEEHKGTKILTPAEFLRL
ncbi:MAG: putative toxin-antitoxin system toxin component, PIN family [Paludibacteraceae bacterium]|nr:putative toxin-antitoxin system toxin component, PIN family [Paludibacteraceae bacterium]